METMEEIVNQKGRMIQYIGYLVLLAGLFLPAVSLAAGGQSQSAASNRGRYLTGLGYIYQPEEIQIDSLLSKEDYDYPLPQNRPLNVTVDSDIQDTTGFIQIGLKGKKDVFENIEPMNISFVIDISGSMADRDKLSWVKNSFYIFINKVRQNDIISVVIFDDKVEVLIPPASIKDENDRNQFKRKVDTLQPRGGTDILKGMNLGYAQVEQNYRSNYINRVLLLTDGMHNGSGTKDDIVSIAKRYNSSGINISTIALGASADINLMVDMATNGGGSSRFISDYDEMEETFGSELDRLVIPAARMLNMELILEEGVSFRETWGYKNWIGGNIIHYSLDTIHNGDYETLFAVVNFNKIPDRDMKIATFSISYEETNGVKHQNEAYDVYISNDSLREANTITNRRIKKGEGFVAYGKRLIEIGELANSIVKLQGDYQRTNDVIIKDQLIGYLNNGLNMIKSISTYLGNINNSIGGNEYHDELTTLNNYEKSFITAYNSYTMEQN
jgi:Ca-activated chloride channel family protein